MPSGGITIFGVLNVTRDSFSDGGRFLEPAVAVEHAMRLVEDGADVVDVGAVSSHPEAEEVPAAEEIRRLSAVVPELVRRGVAVSVDSWRPEVQRWALAQGVAWLNDIRGFGDASFHPELAASTAGLVVMHSTSRGPRARREEADAEAVWTGLLGFCDARVAELVGAGVARGRIVLDPGMGLFLAANPEPSLLVLDRIPQLKERYGLPVFVGVSRKSFVTKIARFARAARGVTAAARRDSASLAAELYAVERGATFLRTHDPRPLRASLAGGSVPAAPT